MVLNPENLPKRKRGEVIFRFESFCEPGYPTRFTGLSFRENIEALLGFGSAELTGTHGEAKFWSFQLELNRHPPTTVRLIVVEEDVKKSSCRQCRYCRFIGMAFHFGIFLCVICYITCSYYIYFRQQPIKTILTRMQQQVINYLNMLVLYYTFVLGKHFTALYLVCYTCTPVNILKSMLVYISCTTIANSSMKLSQSFLIIQHSSFILMQDGVNT